MASGSGASSLASPLVGDGELGEDEQEAHGEDEAAGNDGNPPFLKRGMIGRAAEKSLDHHCFCLACLAGRREDGAEGKLKHGEGPDYSDSRRPEPPTPNPSLSTFWGWKVEENVVIYEWVCRIASLPRSRQARWV